MSDINDNWKNPGMNPQAMDQPGGADSGEYGGDAVLDLIASEGLEEKKRSGAFVIVVVVVLAAAGLFSMRTLNKVVGDSGSTPIDSSRVDRIIAQIGSGKPITDEHQKALDAIHGDFTQAQVAADKVGDPFLVATADNTGPTGPATTGNLEADVEAAIGAVKVQAVLGGSTALVSGKAVQVGDTIEVRKIRLKITAIGGSSVTVLADYPEEKVRVERTVYMKRW